jgi:hypothetical protein
MSIAKKDEMTVTQRICAIPNRRFSGSATLH